jgi:prolyl 4-hydroxylase
MLTKQYIIFIIIFILLLSIILIDDLEPFSYAEDESEYILPQVYYNIISDFEREYIVDTATSKFEDSEMVSGKDLDYRKSQTCWLYKDDPIIYNIIKRICDKFNHPVDNSEQLQVVKYEPNGFYKEHHDSCCDENDHCSEFIKNGGNRVLTFIISLSDEYDGGETFFPNLHTKYKLPKNGGLLFYPLEKNGDKCHPKALHAGMPVITGTKYIANVWIHQSQFN